MHVAGRKPLPPPRLLLLSDSRDCPHGCQVTKGAHVLVIGRNTFGLCDLARGASSAVFTDPPRCSRCKIMVTLSGGFMKTLPATILMCSLLLPAFAANDEKEEGRVKESGEVLKEILNIPDNIPQDLLDKAECVVILPSVKKAAFGIGGSYGRGVMICRSRLHYTGPWGAPALYALEGVNIGFQIGGQATDFVLLVMNPKGAQSLLSSKVKLGGDASAAAGPKGRTAETATDVVMKAEVLS